MRQFNVFFKHKIISKCNLVEMKMYAIRQEVLALGGNNVQRRACIRVLFCVAHTNLGTMTFTYVCQFYIKKTINKKNLKV